MPVFAEWAYAEHTPLVPVHVDPIRTVPNRKDKRAFRKALKAAKGKPSKGTPKDKRLKRNKRGKK